MKKGLAAAAVCLAVLAMPLPVMAAQTCPVSGCAMGNCFMAADEYGMCGNHCFTDENGDGICDYHCYADEDGDGICDYFADDNGDGICDHCHDHGRPAATAAQGGRWGGRRGCCRGGYRRGCW